MPRPWLFIVPLAYALSACSSVPSSANVAATDFSPLALPQTAALVWTTDTDGTPETFAVAADGTTLRMIDGIHLFLGGTEWTWEEAREDVATSPCDDDARLIPPGEGYITRVRLVPVNDRASAQAVVDPDEEAGESNTIEHTARLVASMGSYLFIEESTHSFACGAHGNTSVSFLVWDLTAAHPVDLMAELPDIESIIGLGQTAIDAQPDAIDFATDENPAKVTEFVPHILPDGQIKAEALVTVPSCFACTNGGYGSYTASTPVAVPLPARLRQLGPPPRAVILFLREHPELKVGGYSLVT
jgi:hypothetical protein